MQHHFASWDDLERWFGFFIEIQKNVNCERSCPVGTIGAELSGKQRQLRADACEIFEYTRNALAVGFRHMQQARLLDKSANPVTLANFCFTIMQGGLLVAKIERNSTPFEHAARHAMTYLRSLKS